MTLSNQGKNNYKRQFIVAARAILWMHYLKDSKLKEMLNREIQVPCRWGTFKGKIVCKALVEPIFKGKCEIGFDLNIFNKKVMNCIYNKSEKSTDCDKACGR